MKKQLLFCFSFLIPLIFSAQNGMADHPMPQNYLPSQLTAKRAIGIDSAGNKWLATSVGLMRYNGTWTVYDMSNAPFNTNSIYKLNTAGTKIWAATLFGQISGLYSFDGTTWIDHSAAIGTSRVTTLASQAHSSEVWCGTYQNGLFYFDGANWMQYNTTNSALVNDTINSVSYDASGNLWIGTRQGLQMWNGTNFTSYPASAIGIPSSNISLIYGDPYFGLWFVVANYGLYKWNGSDASPINDFFPECANLYNVNVLSITHGLNGGIMFPGSNNRLLELAADGMHEYFYPEYISGPVYMAHNYADGKVWLVHSFSSQNSPYINLLEFDAVNYSDESFLPGIENTKYLNVNNVEAAILNRGDMHWQTPSSILPYSPKYEVPKGSGKGTVFATSLWLGGLDGAENLHMAAMTYRQTGMDFFPGPLDTVTGTTDSATAFQYDRIWKIDKTEILDFITNFANGNVQTGTYVPSNDFLEWPAHGSGNYSRNLAPFVDVNGNGIYDPIIGGDYPKIRGDQMLFTIFNDNLAVHSETGGAPLKAEIHASAYAYYCPNVLDSEQVINHTTYYHYEVYHRGDENYHKVHFGVWQDSDLGLYDDDYVGCLPERNMAFTYNDSIDGYASDPRSYGDHAPTSSILILDGPPAVPGDSLDNDNDGTTDEAGEHNLMHSFRYYSSDFSAVGNPQTAEHFYYYITDRWQDATPVVIGSGNWYGNGTPTQFMFPGIPWQDTLTEIVYGNMPFDRKMLVSCGPFDLNAGSNVSFDYAIMYSRDTMATWGQPSYFNRMLADESLIRNWYINNNAPSCVASNLGLPPETEKNKFNLYPNPASQTIFIEYEAEENNALYEFYDLTGRKIETGPLRSASLTPLHVAALPPGVYLLRIVDGQRQLTHKWVKQ